MKYFILALIFLCLAFVCNDIEDTLAHHYTNSIFYDGDQSFWNPSWDRIEPIAEMYPALPRCFYDGWHLIKIFRQIFGYLALWFAYFWVARGAFFYYKPDRKVKWHFLAGLFLYGAWIYIIHWIFYAHLFVKD